MQLEIRILSIVLPTVAYLKLVAVLFIENYPKNILCFFTKIILRSVARLTNLWVVLTTPALPRKTAFFLLTIKWKAATYKAPKW